MLRQPRIVGVRVTAAVVERPGGDQPQARLPSWRCRKQRGVGLVHPLSQLDVEGVQVRVAEVFQCGLSLHAACSSGVAGGYTPLARYMLPGKWMGVASIVPIQREG